MSKKSPNRACPHTERPFLQTSLWQAALLVLHLLPCSNVTFGVMNSVWNSWNRISPPASVPSSTNSVMPPSFGSFIGLKRAYRQNQLSRKRQERVQETVETRVRGDGDRHPIRPTTLSLGRLTGLKSMYQRLALNRFRLHRARASHLVLGAPLVGRASYYQTYNTIRHTANGDIFDNNAFTAAHLTLPFGTKLKVTNLSNGLSINVTVTDRGPYIKDRIIDVTQAAAKELGFTKEGLANVEIRLVEP